MNAAILIVEDDPVMAEALAESVSSRFPDDNIVLCASGEHALNVLETNPFEVVVTDFDLGLGPDGVDIIAAALSSESKPYTIIFSGLDRSRDFKERGAREPDVYVTKGDPEQLFEAVEIGLAARQAAA